MRLAEIGQAAAELNRHSISSAQAAVTLAETALSEHILLMGSDGDMLEVARAAAAVALARIELENRQQ